ncbi:phage tail tape measure protein [Amedibacillus sp. YH-ame6]
MKMLGVLGAGMAGLGTLSISLGSQFETSFAKASTMFGDVNVDTENLTDKILKLSEATGISANELNEGLYSSLSAGIPVTKDMGIAMEFLETSTLLARGGFTSTEKSVDALTTVLNGYKMESKDATKVADMLLMTQNKGKTTVDELASSIANVVPTASSLGVSFEEVSASLATMTAQGVPTAQATTQLNQMLAELGKSGTVANTAMMDMYEGMGYGRKTFQELMDEGVNVVDIIADMETYAKDNGKSLLDMFGSIEAGKSALAMAGDNAVTYCNNLEAMRNSSGSTKEAAEKMNDTFDVQLQRLKAIGSSKLIEFYGGIKDSLKDVVKYAVEFVSSLDVESVIKGASVLAGVLATVLAVVISLRGAFALLKFMTIAGEVVSLGTAISTSLVAPLGALLTALAPIIATAVAIIAVIALVTTAIYQLWNENEVFRQTVMNAWNSIMDTLTLFWNVVGKPIFDAITRALLNIWENGIKPLWDAFKEFIANLVMKLAEFWESIKPIVDFFITVFGPIIVNTLTWVADTFGNMVSIVMSLLGALLKNIGEIVGGILDFFGGIIDFIVGVFTGDWEKAWSGIVRAFKGIFDTIYGIAKIPINLIIGLVNGMIGGVESGINYIVRAVNGLSFDLPDWLGGGHFGFDLNEVSFGRVAYLERGGILPKGKTGYLEGNGAEAVIPLDKNKYWTKSVARQMLQYMPQASKTENSQTVNFYQPVETPDDVSRRLRIDARMGLIG